MATNKRQKMFASSLDAMFNDLTQMKYSYAPPQGIEELRDLWQQKCCVTIQTYQSTTCHDQLLRMH